VLGNGAVNKHFMASGFPPNEVVRLAFHAVQDRKKTGLASLIANPQTSSKFAGLARNIHLGTIAAAEQRKSVARTRLLRRGRV